MLVLTFRESSGASAGPRVFLRHPAMDVPLQNFIAVYAPALVNDKLQLHSSLDTRFAGTVRIIAEVIAKICREVSAEAWYLLNEPVHLDSSFVDEAIRGLCLRIPYREYGYQKTPNRTKPLETSMMQKHISKRCQPDACG